MRMVMRFGEVLRTDAMVVFHRLIGVSVGVLVGMGMAVLEAAMPVLVLMHVRMFGGGLGGFLFAHHAS